MRSKAVIQRVLTWCEAEYRSRAKDGLNANTTLLEGKINTLRWVLKEREML
jgi:hypothetical protein|tara:strand:+ start:226 stop:378 length:153 start_codon:yes stop_codon:yes gene_type:complete